MWSKTERLHFGLLTGVFMVAAYILFNMGAGLPGLKELKELNELYFILISLFVGFLVAQGFLFGYKRSIKGMKRRVQ